jgi:hypothetical protein
LIKSYPEKIQDGPSFLFLLKKLFMTMQNPQPNQLRGQSLQQRASVLGDFVGFVRKFLFPGGGDEQQDVPECLTRMINRTTFECEQVCPS